MNDIERKMMEKLGLKKEDFKPKIPEESKNIMTAPNGDKFEIVIENSGEIKTKIAESERGMLL